jgi:hypothetical protein
MTTATKYFTPEEARKTLPLVRQIVKDILDTTREMRLIAEEISGTVEKDPHTENGRERKSFSWRA